MLPITQMLLVGKYRPERPLKQMKGIVIHWTANTNRGADARANRNYFNNGAPGNDGKPREASAHYCVDDHSIIQCVPDEKRANHVGARWKSYTPTAHQIMDMPKPGSNNPNNYLIGIEMCVNSDGDFQKTLQHTIELTRMLLDKHGLSEKDVYRHFDITGKVCPKMMVDDPKQWEAFLEAIRQPVAAVSETPAVQESTVLPAEQDLVTVTPAPAPVPVRRPAPVTQAKKVQPSFLFWLLDKLLAILKVIPGITAVKTSR